MIPSFVVTAVIGNEIPDIVNKCISKNKVLLKNRGIKYLHYRVERNFEYASPGIQVEFLKPFIMSENKNVLYIDWDVELLDIPDLPAIRYPYFGKWDSGTKKFDTFIMQTTTVSSCQFFRSIVNTMSTKSKNRVGIPCYLINDFPLSLTEYPAQYYVHHHTRCGGLDIGIDFASLSIDEKNKINQRQDAPWPVR